MTEGEKRQLRKDLRSLELRIKDVDKNIFTKMVEAYSKSQKYTDLLEEKVKNQQEVLETLISWLSYDLGPQNSITLLNKLKEGK